MSFLSCHFHSNTKYSVLILYASATEMADRGPNPDLWAATAGPRQPIRGVFLYAEVFIPIFWAFGRTFKHLPNCVIVDQGVVQLNCSAHLSWASYDFSVQSKMFVIIVQQ